MRLPRPKACADARGNEVGTVAVEKRIIAVKGLREKPKGAAPVENTGCGSIFILRREGVRT